MQKLLDYSPPIHLPLAVRVNFPKYKSDSVPALLRIPCSDKNKTHPPQHTLQGPGYLVPTGLISAPPLLPPPTDQLPETSKWLRLRLSSSLCWEPVPLLLYPLNCDLPLSTHWSTAFSGSSLPGAGASFLRISPVLTTMHSYPPCGYTSPLPIGHWAPED